MNEDTTQKKKFSNIEVAYQSFKEKMADLRKKQNLILNNFSQKAKAKNLKKFDRI